MFAQWNGEPFATAQFALQVADNAEDGINVAAAFDGKTGVLLRAREECNRSPARLIWAMRADCRI